MNTISDYCFKDCPSNFLRELTIEVTFLLAAFGNNLCKNGKHVQCDLLNFADQSAEICM